jgi:hypothetical protein
MKEYLFVKNEMEYGVTSHNSTTLLPQAVYAPQLRWGRRLWRSRQPGTPCEIRLNFFG